jgi:hypothetical protein
MCTEVILVKKGSGYRVVFGHLRLASLHMNKEIVVQIKEEGKANVIRTSNGLLVRKNSEFLPIFNSAD